MSVEDYFDYLDKMFFQSLELWRLIMEGGNEILVTMFCILAILEHAKSVISTIF